MVDDNLIRWWWNGRWGKLARYDVKVYAEGRQRWRVEAWTGGVEGRVRAWDHLDAAQTRELFADLTEEGDWRDMTPLGKNQQS